MPSTGVDPSQRRDPAIAPPETGASHRPRPSAIRPGRSSRGCAAGCTPAWRPWPLAAGIVLVALAPTAPGKVGGAVFLAASVLLFGTSGIYHRGNWEPRGEAVLRRMDHANIYVFIAATYTPLALMLLDRAVPDAAAGR